MDVGARYLFVSPDGSFSASEYADQFSEGASITLAALTIPVGETRHIAIARPVSEDGGADFTSVLYDSDPAQQIADWINVSHNIQLGDVQLRLIRTRAAVGPVFNSRTIEAL